MTDRLERLRDRAVMQIKTILKFAETINDNVSIQAITTHLESLETRYHAFNEYEVELFANENYVPITEAVDETYYKARTLLKQAEAGRITTSTDSSDLNTTLENFIGQQRTFYEGINATKQARLPKLNIEPFSGTYQYWPSFHDLYTTTVHNNKNLSNVLKFQILTGLLKGDAASLVRHIAITETNYTEAWEKLCNRYKKRNPIMHSLVQSFFEQKPCQQANSRDLRRITETADEVIRGLRALGAEAERRDPWLLYIMLMKVDNETKQLWAKEAVTKDFPTFNEFIQFLNGRCDAIEMCEATAKKLTSTGKIAKTFVANVINPIACIICKDSHPIHKCPTFKNMAVEVRDKAVIENELCYNCLRKGHVSGQCYNKTSCFICRKRHHTLLHQSQGAKMTERPHASSAANHHSCSNGQLEVNKPIPSESNQSSPATNHTNVLYTLYSVHDTILPTALVYVKSTTGQLQLARALLDSGSQMSFVTESCIQNLGLKRSHSSISIHGLASTSAGTTKGNTDMTIISRVNKQYTIQVNAHIIPKITSLLPTKQHPLFQHPILQRLNLADPEFHNHNVIDILLGAEVFFEILSSEKQMIVGLPTLQNSKFGWLIAGSFSSSSRKSEIHHAAINLYTTNNQDEEINETLKRFWKVEEIPDQPQTTAAENWCEAFYLETTTRDSNGRVSVRLPFNQPRQQLGNSYQIARRRLLATEKRFTTSPQFFNEYKDFMNDYLKLGHMHSVNWSEIPEDDDTRYFIPHHAVTKLSSSTTKLRVVFDASCKTTTSVSLNDILRVGPNIQRDLTSIVLRFRKPMIALVADITKMYRQIKVNSTDANYQLILWREKSHDPISIYKLNTVTYGTACAPFLAVRTLQNSTSDFKDLYPKASHAICNDFYIDDLLTGCDSLEEALLLKEQMIEILGSSGFQLRKWKSNSSNFLQSFSQDDIENIPKLIEDDSSIKTLGIMWHAESDIFSFQVQQSNCKSWTKRSMLSIASKVYDPLGWLAPVIILFKIILQKLWLLNVEWDTQLPDDIIQIWENLYDNIMHLESIKIPRRLTHLQNRAALQLHAFCDASEAAYGSVIYVHAEDGFGNVTVNMVCAKGRVAPIKQISLPRLELCGAVLLCELVKSCIQSLEYEEISIYAWTDSMIVLHWLSDVPRRWKSFIGNRTSKILDSIPRRNWAHIASSQNPADHITRGVKPQLMSNLVHWWHGPQWLSEHENNWPITKESQTTIPEIILEEREKFVNVFLKTTPAEDAITQLTTNCSSWFKIRKIMVYILRALKPNIYKPRELTISPTELSEAETVILRNIQKTAFEHELSIISKGSNLSAKHYLSALDPIIDAKGLLRVGGRLRNSPLPFTTKHPILLPKDHPINNLIIREIHYTHLHAGNSLILNILRQRYWMIGVRHTIKRQIKTCVICIRNRSIKNEQKMGDLPTARCSISRPFLKTGLDYAGPFHIKTSRRKNAPSEKAYIAVFVCLCVKAVHLEVVSGLDTDAFLAALKRFTSRRGLPEEIWCDNGGNFIGADRELRRMKKDIINQQQNNVINEFLLQKNITFHFIPPRAPNFGGLWEASVKSTKYHLKRVINSSFTFEELTTIVTQIESLLNSRPLCRIDDDPTNLQPLTPGHFLIGEQLVAIPEPTLEDIKINKLSRWQNVQRRVQGFFKCWSRDYLSTLQHRYKWKNQSEQIAVDDVVLIKEDNLRPNQWLLGRVISIHPGRDDIVRVVTLKTAQSEVKRPVNKLIKLPVHTNQSS